MPNKLHMIEPVEIFRTRHHQFASRVPKSKLERGQKDLCKECMLGKHNPRFHHAFPESVNRRSNTGWESSNSTTKYWYEIFTELLVKSGLPTGLARVYVEAEYNFGLWIGRRQKPDQENFRYTNSKALADTIVRGGWITDDSWSDEIQDFQFEFGGLRFRFDDEPISMRLTIFPYVSLAREDGVGVSVGQVVTFG
jgi:hypothetical protein